MTKTVNKFLSVLLAIAMIFSLSVIGFAAGETFGLKSGSAVAASGSFKDKYVANLKITVKSNNALIAADDFSVNIKGTDGQNKTFKSSDAKIEINEKTAVITVAYESAMQHEAEYTVTVAAGSFKDSDGKLSKSYSFSTTGNLILEKLNGNRPSTTMQKFIKWLSSWKYADIIKPIIDLLKWFDNL